MIGYLSLNDDDETPPVPPDSPPTANPDPDEGLAILAKALGHPARLRILRLLARTPGCIGGDIVQAVGLAQSTVSEHLRILKAAGVIEGQIDPPRICYALVPGALGPLAALIATLDTATTEAGCCLTPDSDM
jgi:ArsR family transcriptional regulator, arsenate/arsenite/antimonite-responsive transcriptional repressor